jgi:hypothetical protein
MQKREKTQIVQLSKLRIREELRAQLEKEARRSGTSLNGEIERRLEASFTSASREEIHRFTQMIAREVEDLKREKQALTDLNEYLKGELERGKRTREDFLPSEEPLK